MREPSGFLFLLLLNLIVMVIYVVIATHVFSDNGNPDIASYHTTEKGAQKKLDELIAICNDGYSYDEMGNPLYEWNTKEAYISEINVNEEE